MVSGKNPVNCAILLTFLWRYDTAKNQKKKANFQINHQSLGTALHRYFVFRTAVPKYPYEQRGYLCLVPTLSFPLPVLVVLWLDVYQPARNIPGLYFANYAVKENNLPTSLLSVMTQEYTTIPPPKVTSRQKKSLIQIHTLKLVFHHFHKFPQKKEAQLQQVCPSAPPIHSVQFHP